MDKPTWIKRIARRIRGLRQIPVRPDDVVTLGLLRMEDRVLLDASGLVTALPGLGDDFPAASSTPTSVSNAILNTAAEQASRSALATTATAPSIVEVSGGELVFRVAELPHLENHVIVSTDGTQLTFRDEAGAPIISTITSAVGSGTNELSVPFASIPNVHGLVVNVIQEEDSVTFDLSQHADAFLSQFSTTRLLKSEDHLRFVGDGELDATLRLAPRTRETSTLSIGKQDLTTEFKFTFTYTVDLVGMRTANVVTPSSPVTSVPLELFAGKSFLEPGEDALVARYGGETTPIMSVHLHANESVNIDGGGVVGPEKITVLSADNDHRNENLMLDTRGAGDHDLIRIQGEIRLAGDLAIRTGQLDVNAPIIAGEEVRVVAQSDINFGSPAGIAAEAVTLHTVNGRIESVPDAGRLVADVIELTAGAGIGSAAVPLHTTAEYLLLDVTGPGSIFLRNSSDTTLERAQTSNGAIDITAAGSLTGKGVTSLTNSAANDITLSSEFGDVVVAGRIFGGDRARPAGDVTITALRGRIFDEPSATNSGVFANVLTLTSAAGIGTVDNPFVTSVNELRLDVSATGSIFVGETSSAQLASATTHLGVIQVTAGDTIGVGDVRAITDANGGGIRIEAGGGDITIDGAMSVVRSTGERSGNVSLIASRGGIRSNSGNSIPDISSRSAVLVAGQDLGQLSNNLELNVEILAASAGGDAWIANQGPLLVDSLSDQHGIRAGQDVRIAAESLVTVAGISAGGDIEIVLDGRLPQGGTLNLAGDLNSDRGSISLDLTNASTASGQIVAGGDFSKLGSGSLTLTSQNQTSIHGSTTVVAGGLTVHGRLETSRLIVSPNTTLTGSGVIEGDAFIRQGATLTPGSGWGRTLTVSGDLHLDRLSTVKFDISSPTTSTSVRVVGGQLFIDDAMLVLSVGPAGPPDGASFTLVDSAGTGPVAGTFLDSNGNSIREGDIIPVGQSEAIVTYSGGVGGNDIVVRIGGDRFFIPLTVGQEVQSAAVFNFFIPTTTRVAFERAQLPVLPVPQESAETLTTNRAIQQPNVEFEAAQDEDFQLYFKVYDDALGTEGEDAYSFESPEEAIGQLPKAFEDLGAKGLPDGHYRVYLREAGSTEERLVQEIFVFEGKVVPRSFQGESTPVEADPEALDPVEAKGVADESVQADQSRGEELPNKAND